MTSDLVGLDEVTALADVTSPLRSAVLLLPSLGDEEVLRFVEDLALLGVCVLMMEEFSEKNKNKQSKISQPCVAISSF